MTSKINQIQASYKPVEDRILLTIKTFDEQVYLAWITRRYLQLLLPALQGAHPTTGESLFSEQISMENQVKQQAATDNADFETPYQAAEEPNYPLGEEPVLLAQITFKDMQADSATLILAPEVGQGLQLPFSPDLSGALLKILQQAIETANWDITITVQGGRPAGSRLQ